MRLKRFVVPEVARRKSDFITAGPLVPSRRWFDLRQGSQPRLLASWRLWQARSKSTAGQREGTAVSRQNNPRRAEPWVHATRAALAISSYLLLHAVAMRPRVLVIDPSQFGPALPGLVLGWMAESLQFVLPVLLLFGAAPVRRARSFLAPTAAVPVHAGQGMTGFEFERLIGGGLRFPRRARGHAGPPSFVIERSQIPDRLAA